MSRPHFDIECQEALEVISEQLPPSIGSSDLGILRPEHDDSILPTDDELSLNGFFRVSSTVIPETREGPAVPVLECVPNVPQVRGAMLYLHGGGLVGGHFRQGLPEVLNWAAEHHFAVFSVSYRLAPEDPYPAAADDVYRALRWAAEGHHGVSFPEGRIVVAGVSAGAGLAASMLLRSRDVGGPSVLGGLLAGPMLDDRSSSVSARQMQGVGVWDRSSNRMGWQAYLGPNYGGSSVSPYAAPGRARNLADLPPLYIDVGSAETFRDEAVEFASRIWFDGGDCELHVWPGGFHAYAALAPSARISVETREARANWIRRLVR